MFKAIKNYASLLILAGGILIGALLGVILKERAAVLKPLGDIFLNLLFTAVVPLVFFSISSAIAVMTDGRRLARIMGWMMVFFTLTGLIASGIMIGVVHFFPPFQGVMPAWPGGAPQTAMNTGDAIVRAFTAPDFADILSKKNMLALIVMAILVGIAAARSGEKGKPFVRFLEAGNEVMTRVIGIIMLYAPVGLGAYFAYLVGVFGPQLMGQYVRVVQLYYPVAFLYFGIAFSVYVFWAGGIKGLKAFWTNIPQTALTALATGSSVASIPVNLAAAQKSGVPEDIREVIIPVGATIHMEGSCLAAIVKIAFLFGVFHMPFAGLQTWLTAAVIAVLCGTVISGIPSGGMLGELLIVTLYGFPIEAMPLITMIGTIVDPPATMLNSVGDNVTSMMVARKLNGVHWMKGGA
ncbi:MAG: dicarboxylate/amino acid:cation symporter [Candidatus Omnitrophica bacterium]|nr:dicarboxylate/amino acid:cation symporter [Candidatus Omnitrophota bacterium]